MTKVVMPLPPVVTIVRAVDVYVQGADSPAFTYLVPQSYSRPDTEAGARVSRVSVTYTKEGDDGEWNTHSVLYIRKQNASGNYSRNESTLPDRQWPEAIDAFVKLIEQENEPRG